MVYQSITLSTIEPVVTVGIHAPAAAAESSSNGTGESSSVELPPPLGLLLYPVWTMDPSTPKNDNPLVLNGMVAGLFEWHHLLTATLQTVLFPTKEHPDQLPQQQGIQFMVQEFANPSQCPQGSGTSSTRQWIFQVQNGTKVSWVCWVPPIEMLL